MRKKRIVVKIGSSSLTNDKGEIDQEKLNDHIHAVAALRKAKHEVILVSSGAVAAGFARLGYPSRPVTIKGRQAAAAVGQGLLIESYIEKFSEFNIIPAQILLTRNDFSNRDRYRNAFATIMELLERGILPIINENDTVSVEELTFGDNDMLSALVSGFIHADQLIILTDINGLYDSNPRVNPLAKKLDVLEDITDEMLEGADSAGSKVGTGGMKSKLLAAKTALSLSVPVFIGHGNGPDKLLQILKGNGDGTYISNSEIGSINTSRQWIAFHSESAGKLFVDQGAEEAILYNGKSLLPAGVFKVKGTFEKGDVVEVFGANGLLGKGEVSYSSDDLKKAIENRSEELRSDSFVPSIEVIHRNRWVKV
ncbi:glutamate 5-kinase [Lederbergia citrea]|uniref:Glutamate 5-kinase n=1 Tax=Lederbergia citrea TaxID=2833581 RepID=A0A942Z1Y8_9BACI|nr:glutamate 5-kinase [Lederbergia citrea]MBS4176799.1 glutamate 5-kinase [Lederbergia citrea]MBS4203359.1 glutamate 5-kinase [Lederbergia citrea]MBS4221968.1 glutamate 5-kinase [Lederbergia citrea]